MTLLSVWLWISGMPLMYAFLLEFYKRRGLKEVPHTLSNLMRVIGWPVFIVISAIFA